MIVDETDGLGVAASFVGLLYSGVPDINWLGLYLLRDASLVLGPFQGQPACMRIPLGRGVCGTAAEKKKTIRVDNVHAFAGHIVCDPRSVAELVVRLTLRGKLLGVLDIDSPTSSRFSGADQRGVESLCRTFLRHLDKCHRRSDVAI